MSTKKIKAAKSYQRLRRAYGCQDGPWAMKTLYLVTANTLPLVIGKHRGRYVRGETGNLIWEPLK